MEKKYAIIPNNKFDKVVQEFTDVFGLPEILRKLSVYAYDDQENQLHINFFDQRCDIKYIPVNNTEKSVTPPIFIENKNLKQLFSMVYSLGFREANIGFILSLNYKLDQETKISLSKETFVDNVSEVNFNPSKSESLLQVEKIFNKFGIKLIERKDLLSYLGKKNLIKENVVDKFGCLNPKIKRFGEMVGIDVLSNTKSLRNRMKKFSNDYSLYESLFSEITNADLNGINSTSENSIYFKPISVVIPCYDSNDTILKTLYSIQSQFLSEPQKKLIDVVLVDDGSKEPVFDIIKDKLGEFSFSVKVIRLEKNNGLSTARNLGIFCSKNDILILLDSDILLPKNYLLEHSIRNQLIPHAVFVSLKKNIENDSEFADIEKIKSGLESPVVIDDLRIYKDLEQGQLGVHDSTESETIEILNDTNYFKEFGFGRAIGIFDIASMVIGHNLSIRRKTLDKCKYFSSNFVGWGLEDSYFGAKIIANGNFVIPVLSSNVYHINHTPRSGSEENKQKEFKENISIYNQLLDQEFD